jgi:hypothetical protein
MVPRVSNVDVAGIHEPIVPPENRINIGVAHPEDGF